MDVSLCATCKRMTDDDAEIETCEAFPDGIPDKVLFGEVPHNKPIKGDNGLQYLGEPGFEDRGF